MRKDTLCLRKPITENEDIAAKMDASIALMALTKTKEEEIIALKPIA